MKVEKENFANSFPFNKISSPFTSGLVEYWVTASIKESSSEFKLFLLEKEDYEIDYSLHNPTTIGYGEVDRFLEILKSLKIQHIVFIGAVNKPNFSNLKVDKSGAILVAKIIANKILGVLRNWTPN